MIKVMEKIKELIKEIKLKDKPLSEHRGMCARK